MITQKAADIGIVPFGFKLLCNISRSLPVAVADKYYTSPSVQYRTVPNKAEKDIQPYRDRKKLYSNYAVHSYSLLSCLIIGTTAAHSEHCSELHNISNAQVPAQFLLSLWTEQSVHMPCVKLGLYVFLMLGQPHLLHSLWPALT